MPDVFWFRQPSDDDAGTLNATFQLLDRAVIAGHGEDLATEDRDHARLLEDVAAFGGVLRGFGLVPGDRVLVADPDDDHSLIAVLAALRIGAVVVDAGAVALTVDADGVRPAADPDPVAWDVLMRAGRTDPAGAADLPPDHPAVETGRRTRSTHDLAHELGAVTAPTTAHTLLAVMGL